MLSAVDNHSANNTSNENCSVNLALLCIVDIYATENKKNYTSKHHNNENCTFPAHSQVDLCL